MISKTYYRYIWLLDTLLNSSPLTIDEINMLWEDCPLSNGPIPLRTFHEQRKGIKEMFGVEMKQVPVPAFHKFPVPHTISVEGRSLIRTFLAGAI